MKIVPPNEIPKLEEIGPTPVDKPIKLFGVFQEMGNLCAKENGIGLSAVQVGIPWKAFVVRYPGEDGKLSENRYLIDCEYEGIGEKVDSVEGCLSLRTPLGGLRHFLISRNEEIRLTGKELLTDDTLAIVDVDECVSGYYAIVYQHEIEHHHAVLISDIGTEIQVWQ